MCCVYDSKIETIYKKLGFCDEYRGKTEDFYRKYFTREKEMKDFFKKVFIYETKVSNQARLMMNQVRRFITLANEINETTEGSQPLQLLFYKICLESLAHNSGLNNRSFFERFESLVDADDCKELCKSIKITTDSELQHETLLNEVFNIISAVRHSVVHEGNCWNFSLFSCNEFSVCSTIETDFVICESLRGERYEVTTTLKKDKFEYILVKTCIKYILDFCDNHSASE